MVMSAYRRSVVADTKKKGGGGRRGNFWERFRLPTALVSAGGAPFVLIKQEFIDPNPPDEMKVRDPVTGQIKEVKVPYKKAPKHRRRMVRPGNKEYFVDDFCSAGHDPHNPQPCVGCFYADSGDKSFGSSDVFGLGLVHLAYYHGHPIVDDNGQWRVKQDGTMVIVYDECTGRTCNFCRSMQGLQLMLQPNETWPNYPPNSLSVVFGRRRYFELGKGHLEDLFSFDQQVLSQCATCKSQLNTEGFACPDCNSMVIDLASDPRTDKEIADAVLHPYPCMRCQKPVLLKEIVYCDPCEAAGRQMTQLSMFDVVLFANRQGEGTKSHVVMARPPQTIEEFEQTVDPRFLGGKRLREYIAELAQPYDFDELFAPKPLADQARRYEVQLPPGMGGGAPQGQPYQAYGQAPQQGGYAPAPGAIAPGGFVQPGGYTQPAAPAAPGYATFQQPGQPVQGQPAPGPVPFAPPGRPNFGQ